MAARLDPVDPDARRSTTARRRRVLRFVLAGSLLVLAAVAVAAAVATRLEKVAAPLRLPSAEARPSGTLNGSWVAGNGSTAGVRIPETVMFVSSEVVGRTQAVSGSAEIADGALARARFFVRLSKVRFAGKSQSSFATILDTKAYPTASLQVGGGARLDTAALASGKTESLHLSATLVLHGRPRPVLCDVELRRSAGAIDAVGRVEISFPTWGLHAPAGLGPIGSLADHGELEFLVVLHRV